MPAGDPDKANFLVTTALGAWVPDAATRTDTDEVLLIVPSGAGAHAPLDVQYTNHDPNLKTLQDRYVPSFHIYNVPDPPWLGEGTGTWISEHTPPPPPGTPEREQWFADLKIFVLTLINEHAEGP